MDNLRFYIIAIALFAPSALLANDAKTIALWGGTNFVNLKNHAFLESLLIENSKESVYLRNISWQADTVYRQQRPRNFGSHRDFLKRVQPNVLILSFGQSEVLKETYTPESFYLSYQQFLSEIKLSGCDIYITNLYLFPKIENTLLPDLSQYNSKVIQFNKQITKLAKLNTLKLIDISVLIFKNKEDSIDGLLLNEKGLKKLAFHIAPQLTELKSDAPSEKLRKKLIFKNELWDRHWRPDNWGFVYGNRTHVPSSRDHINREHRWLPQEVSDIYKEVTALEQQLQKTSK